MSILRDIKKATQIPYTEENASFIRQRDPNAFKRNRKIPKFKVPRNANLYDFDNGDIDDQDNLPGCNSHIELHEHEIASSIREANCGIDYSNESLEEHWRVRQQERSRISSTSSEDIPMFKKATAEVNDGASTSKVKSDYEKKIEDEESVLKRCKLNKNAAIRGLLKSKQISLNDLQIPNNVNIKYGNNTNTQNENIPPSTNLTEENCDITLIQCPEDPDVLVRPLQVYGIDETKYKDIDFTVPHIGKKRIVTPRQFYVQMDDSGFDFVKKDTKRKNN